MKNKALFLDRDGVINIEKNYVYKISDFEFMPEIFQITREYQEQGFLIFVVTNQAGIARNFYTEEDVIKLNNWMVEKFREKGINISKVYICPHHPDFTGECECRKPKPGMILEAIEEFNIDPQKSVLIGDKKSDILAGKNAKIGTNLYIHDLLKNNI
ncbi:MAG: HAD family hydrolase [Prolixibacteraceae bacterium]|nr:HAD family hydrolase [Prolixibacteraceae bacterium]